MRDDHDYSDPRDYCPDCTETLQACRCVDAMDDDLRAEEFRVQTEVLELGDLVHSKCAYVRLPNGLDALR